MHNQKQEATWGSSHDITKQVAHAPRIYKVYDHPAAFDMARPYQNGSDIAPHGQGCATQGRQCHQQTLNHAMNSRSQHTQQVLTTASTVDHGGLEAAVTAADLKTHTKETVAECIAANCTT